MWVTSPSRTFLGRFRGPAARAKRETGSVTVLVQVGLLFAQRKTQTLNTASLCAALTGSQVWLFSWIAPPFLTTPPDHVLYYSHCARG